MCGNYGEGILELTEVRDVFTGEVVAQKAYDVDHFIPWSFVMNDELWNLMPMDSSLNSAKSNKLPKWDPFLKDLLRISICCMGLFMKSREYINCLKDAIEIIYILSGLEENCIAREIHGAVYNILQKNMQPVYDSARRQGYEVWNRGT